MMNEFITILIKEGSLTDKQVLAIGMLGMGCLGIGKMVIEGMKLVLESTTEA